MEYSGETEVFGDRELGSLSLLLLLHPLMGICS